MSEGKKSRLLKWAIWTPVGLVLVGLISLLVMDRRTSEELHKEESRLLAMGVDVRELRPEDDAIEEYNAIAIEVASKRYAFSESVLQRLEEAAKKPIATNVGMAEDMARTPTGSDLKPGDPFSAFYLWMQVASKAAAKKHDWKTLDRLFQLFCRMQIQCLASGAEAVSAQFMVDNTPLGDLASGDPEVRSWLRKKLEKYDTRAVVCAKLSGIGRMAMHARAKSPRGQSLWRQLVEKQTLFRRRANLMFLKEWTPLATRRLEPFNPIGLQQDVTNLQKKLSLRRDWPSEWITSRIFANVAQCCPQLFVHATLIGLDLAEQRDLGKPLTPTWSKRYCFDPENGLPIAVRPAKDKVVLASTLKSNPWQIYERW